MPLWRSRIPRLAAIRRRDRLSAAVASIDLAINHHANQLRSRRAVPQDATLSQVSKVSCELPHVGLDGNDGHQLPCRLRPIARPAGGKGRSTNRQSAAHAADVPRIPIADPAPLISTPGQDADIAAAALLGRTPMCALIAYNGF